MSNSMIGWTKIVLRKKMGYGISLDPELCLTALNFFQNWFGIFY